MNDMDLMKLRVYKIAYEHPHPARPMQMWSTCDECGAVPYPTPSGKINVQWLVPVDEPLYVKNRCVVCLDDNDEFLVSNCGTCSSTGYTYDQVWPDARIWVEETT